MDSGELELARAFCRREAWAYDAAYRTYGAAIQAAALQVLHDPSDANDCVHDVLLRLWRRGSDYRVERGSLRAFLAVCVRNEALSRVRKARTRERVEATLRPAAAAGDPAQGVADRTAIAGALARLGEKQRETISLAYFKHLTLDEIARSLGEPLGTVKSRLSSALRNLRESLAIGDPPHA